MSQQIQVLFLPFLACLVVTGIHVYLGIHVISRKVIFVDIALAQIAAVGATVAFLLAVGEGGEDGAEVRLLRMVRRGATAAKSQPAAHSGFQLLEPLSPGDGH